MAFDVDFFVIGAGSGGVRAARIAAGHGAKTLVAEESRIGTPASFGCIRMRSADVIQLYDIVGVGAKVDITQQTIAQATGLGGPQPAVAEAAPVPRAVAVVQQPGSGGRP